MLSPLRLTKTVKKRVVLENCLAHNYSGNIKPIAEWLNTNYKGSVEIYIVVRHPDVYTGLHKSGIKPIRFHSVKHYLIAMTSAVIVTNAGGYSYLPLKRDQFVINTWHGGGAYKKIGIDAYHTDRFYRRELKLAAKKTNMFLATGTLFADLISNALMIPREVFFEIGMPRNDILLKDDQQLRQRIRKRIGLLEGEKLVLYAPTYRKINDNHFGTSIAIRYGIDSERVCWALTERFGGKWRFAIRMHPQAIRNDEFRGKNVIDLTAYEDMQELLLAADVMINDFSSSMWDFMLTGKPCFLYAPDLQHYTRTTAMYTPVEKLPFSVAENNEELENNIYCFDELAYREACDSHYNKLGGCETGRATQLVCEEIIKQTKIELQSSVGKV